MPAGPTSFRAVTADKAVALIGAAAEPWIHFQIDFGGRLDPDRLARALRLSLDASPVLGSRFSPRWIWPTWKRLAASELDRTELLVLQPEQDAFLSTAFDPREQPQLKAALFNDPEGDRLLLKVGHLAADAGGTKDVGTLVADLYRRLEREPGLSVTPNLESRSLKRLFRPRLPRRLFGLLGEHFRALWSNLRPLRSMHVALPAARSDAPRYSLHRITPERLAAARAAAGPATINDLLLTAWYRVAARKAGWAGPGALRMLGTVDLRRYLPDGRAPSICNYSSLFFANIGRELGATFADTLARVRACTARLNTDLFGLGTLFGAWLSLLPYPFALKRRLFAFAVRRLARSGNVPPAFTNMGPIDDTRLDFGAPPVSDACLICPPAVPPFFLTGMTGFRGGLTLSGGAHEASLPRAELIALLEQVEAELPG